MIFVNVDIYFFEFFKDKITPKGQRIKALLMSCCKDLKMNDFET